MSDSDNIEIGEDNAPAAEEQATTGFGGGTEQTVSILTSSFMQWFFDPSSGNWYVSYKLPNSERHVFFEATGTQLDAIFGEGKRPTGYSESTLQQLTSLEGYTFGGGVAEVQGTGSFESEVQRVIAIALDEGMLPSWAKNDGAIFDLLYIAQSEQKSDDWLIEEIAKLPSFKQRFPGIENIQALGLTVSEAVTGFLELERGVKQLVIRDGGNPEWITPESIGNLLKKGHSLDDVEFTFNIFDTMDKNAGALDAFNEILVARGQQPLDTDQRIAFLSGNAPAELYDIWEEASLNRAAEDAGLNLTPQDAINLARRTEGLTSYGSAMEGLTVAAQNLLRFRTDLALDRFDLDEQDLIDLSLGLAPSSGRTQAEVSHNMERALSAARARTQRARVNPFTGFKPDGTPQQVSLTNIRTEG